MTESKIMFYTVYLYTVYRYIESNGVLYVNIPGIYLINIWLYSTVCDVYTIYAAHSLEIIIISHSI